MLKKYDLKKSDLIVFISSIMISLLYVFFIGQWDMQTITGWGYDLLCSIEKGKLFDFPRYTNDLRQMPSNYTMVANMTTALWLSPVYVIQFITKKVFALEIYELWYKVLIGILHFVDVSLLWNLLKKNNVNPSYNIKCCSLYMTSTIILMAVIGQGQIDIICVFFLLLGYRCLQEEKYYLMAILFGISVIYKPFGILLAFPIILLLIYKNKYKTIILGVLLLLPYGINTFLTKLLMPEYNKYVDLVNEQCKEIMGTNRIEEMFNLKINSMYVFWTSLMILCFVAFYIGVSNRSKKEHFLILPMIGFLTYAVFVSASSYWFILIIPIFLYMGFSLRRKENIYLLNFGVNIGAMFSIYLSEENYSPNPELSIVSYITGKKRTFYFYEHMPNIVSKYGFGIGTTLFVTCVILIVALYCYENKKGEIDTLQKVKENTWGENALLCIQPVPAVVYFVVAVVEYMI